MSCPNGAAVCVPIAAEEGAAGPRLPLRGPAVVGASLWVSGRAGRQPAPSTVLDGTGPASTCPPPARCLPDSPPPQTPLLTTSLINSRF